jgi:hypothetical protein
VPGGVAIDDGLHVALRGAGGYEPPHIDHTYRMMNELLAAENAVTFNSARAIARFPDLVGKPLYSHPLTWRTSAVLRRDNPDPRARRAQRVLAQALQTHDGSRPVTDTITARS